MNHCSLCLGGDMEHERNDLCRQTHTNWKNCGEECCLTEDLTSAEVDWTQARKVRWEMTDEDRARFRELFQGEWIHEPTEPLDLGPQKECIKIPCTLNEP